MLSTSAFLRLHFGEDFKHVCLSHHMHIKEQTDKQQDYAIVKRNAVNSFAAAIPKFFPEISIF